MATPVGVTEALPWFYAGAMYAARVEDTLVTVLALPAIQTPADTEGTMSSASKVGHKMTRSPNTHTHSTHTLPPQQNMQDR